MGTEGLAIETRGLSKQFGEVHALRGLDLRVPAGSIYGFLGRNGAGKTTTLKTLLGMVRATSGEAHVLGLRVGDARDEVTIRRRVAHVGEDRGGWPELTRRAEPRHLAPDVPGVAPRCRAALPASSSRFRGGGGWGASRRARGRRSRSCWRCRAVRTCCCSTSRPRASIPS